jgi:MFS family permease
MRVLPARGPAADGDGLWAAQRRPLTLGLVLTITFIASEALAVITVMPVVAHDLGGLDLYGWVFSAFMLGSVVGIVLAGRETDRRGPALPYIAGVVFFGAGLLVAGLAPSMPVLVGGRALQGLGAGAVPAVAYVAINRSLPDRLRPKMMAMLSTAWVAPGIAGPAASAAVAHLFGWRWVFLGLVPVVAATGSLAIPSLMRMGPAPERSAGTEHRVVDGLGAAAGATLFLAGLTALSGSTTGLVIGVLLAVAGLALGVPVLRRLLPPGALRARPGLPATVLSRGVITFAFFGADAYVTLTITTIRHYPPALAGVAVTAGTLTWTAGSWTQARLAERWSGRRLVRTGLLIVMAGQAAMACVLAPSVPIAIAVLAWAVAGYGMGLGYAPLSLLMMRQAPPGREGWAAASLNLCDVLGTAIGTGVGGAAVAAAVRSGLPLAAGVGIAFAICGAVSFAGLAVSRRLPSGVLRSAPVPVDLGDPAPQARLGGQVRPDRGVGG